jgi:hypothetical protein
MAVILDEYGKYSIKLENGDTAGGYIIDAVFKEMEKLQKKVEELEKRLENHIQAQCGPGDVHL